MNVGWVALVEDSSCNGAEIPVQKCKHVVKVASELCLCSEKSRRLREWGMEKPACQERAIFLPTIDEVDDKIGWLGLQSLQRWW